MDFRKFFATNMWWGKIIGAILGYLIARAVGALFGILIGNIFDRGLAEYFSRPHWHYHTEKQKAIQELFFQTTFSILGLIAKADGRVSENEIQMARTLMQELGLNRAQKVLAKKFFNEGKQTTFNLFLALETLKRALHKKPELIKLFIDIQYHAAQVDGLSHKKQQILNTVLNSLDFASLHKQYRFYEDFANYSSYQRGSSSNDEKKPQQSRYGVLDHAFAILEVPSSADKQEVKRAYRQLMSRNHPDKLIAKGLPETMIKIANEKTQAISKAYKQICDSKGW